VERRRRMGSGRIGELEGVLGECRCCRNRISIDGVEMCVCVCNVIFGLSIASFYSLGLCVIYISFFALSNELL